MISAPLLTIGIIVLAIVLFLTEIISADLVGLLIIFLLISLGILDLSEALQGFSHPATVTIIFMFVISYAVLKTGALQHVTYRLADVFKQSFNKGLLLMMLIVAVISAFVNNTPIVLMFIPVVLQVSKQANISAKKLLIPLSFASILGGMCTIFGTSTNILVQGILEEKGLETFGLFEIAQIGLILLAIGIIYLSTLGVNILRNKRKLNKNKKDFLEGYVSQIQVLEDNKNVGRKILASSFIRDYGIDILEVERSGEIFNQPPGDFLLKANDNLKVRCSLEKIKELKEEEILKKVKTLQIGDTDLDSKYTKLMELVVSANSEIAGKSLREIDFRRVYRASAIAIKQRGEFITDDIYSSKIQAGDVVLAEVKNHYIETLKEKSSKNEIGFIILSENPLVHFNQKRFWFSTLILLTVIGVASLNILPLAVSALGGVILLVASKMISMKEAYSSISWNVIFLIIGALALGKAIEKSGLSANIAYYTFLYLSDYGPWIILSGLYLLTSFLTEFISNNATAALMTPIALSISMALGVNYEPFLIAIMIAASASFITPIGYQTNTLVYNAGNYKFVDFLKIGIVLNLTFWIVSSLLIPYFFPF